MRAKREPEAWRALVTEYVKSERPLREFCRDRGISKSSLSRWSRRFGHGRLPPIASNRGRTQTNEKDRIVIELANGILV